MKKIFKVVSLSLCTVLLCTCSLLSSQDEDADGTSTSNGTQKGILVNGVRTEDTDGNTIFGSGGCILQVGSYFYWYGEHRYSSGNFKGVSCYRSKNLVDWEYRNDVLTEDSSEELNPAFLERPKVIYNKSTGKYVLWAHREGTGWNYGVAQALVAYCDSPDGDFTYVKSFRPFDDPSFNIHDNGYTSDYSDDTSDYSNMPYGYMSRDCTLFIDDDGTAYFASSYRENTRMHIYRLTDDYLDIDTSYIPTDNVLNVNQREAPCLFKRGDYYYMITSGTSGWTATPTKYQYATSLQGPWSDKCVFSDSSGDNNTSDLTHSDRSQPAYVFELTATDGSGNVTYMYMGDRWGPAFGGSSVYDSQYVWGKIEFDESDPTSLYFAYSEALKPDVSAGEINYPQYYYIENKYGQYLVNAETVTSGQVAQWTATAPSGDDSSTRWRDQYLYQFRMIPTTWGYQLVNRYSALAVAATSTELLSGLTLNTKDADTELQSWVLSSLQSPYSSIANASSSYYLTTTNSITSTVNGVNSCFQISWHYINPIYYSSDLTEDAAYATVIQKQSWQFIPVVTNDDEL